MRKLLAVLIAARGATNFGKAYGLGSGLVVLGRLLPPDTRLAPILGVVMLVYAWGLWSAAGWALPLGVLYALFATANIALFPIVTGLPARVTAPRYAAFAALGLAAAWGAVWLLRAARREGTAPG